MQAHVFFKILLVRSILLIAYTLITVYCEAPHTIIIDLALYEIKYYNYIIIKLLKMKIVVMIIINC